MSVRAREKTGDRPNRHARTGRFINDLREARVEEGVKNQGLSQAAF